MYEQIDFHFRHQPSSGTPYAVLLKYLDRKKKGSKGGRELGCDCADELTEFPKEQMILWALSAYWYPSACKALGSFSKAQLRQKAKNAIYQLLQQIYYLIQLFELDPDEFVFPASSGELKSRSEAGSQSGSGMVVQSAEASIPLSSNVIPVAKTEEEIESSFSTLVLARNEDDDELDKAFQ